METKKRSLAHICAYLSLAISITMLVLWCCNVGGFTVVNLDSFVGVIVALLAIIVTLAIGWQIYNSIEIKDKIKKLDNLEEKYSEHDCKKNQIQSQTLHLIWANMGDFSLNNNCHISAFDYYLKSLNTSMSLEKPKNIDILLNRMNNTTDSMQYDTPCQLIESIRKSDKSIRSSKNFFFIKKRYEKIFNDFISKVKEAG